MIGKFLYFSQLYKDIYSASINIIIIQIFSFSLSNYSLDDYQKESLVNRKCIASYWNIKLAIFKRVSFQAIILYVYFFD